MKEVIGFGCFFPEIYENRHIYPSNEDMFQALAEAIKALRGSKLVEVKTYSEGWTAKDFHEQRQAIKFNLLALQGNITITLIKPIKSVNQITGSSCEAGSETPLSGNTVDMLMSTIMEQSSRLTARSS